MVEIMRAVSKSVQILIMDEPTSSLTDTEKQALFDLIASLKRQGVSIIYVSHFLDEVMETLRSRNRHEGRQDRRYSCRQRVEQNNAHSADGWS